MIKITELKQTVFLNEVIENELRPYGIAPCVCVCTHVMVYMYMHKHVQRNIPLKGYALCQEQELH